MVQEPDPRRLCGKVDTCTGVWPPARSPCRRRGVRSLAACIPNRWGGNGTPMAAMARLGFCTRGGRRRRLIASPKEPVDLLFQIRKGTHGQRPARIDHDIPRRRQLREPRPHHFAKASFETVPNDSLSDSSGSCETDTRTDAIARQAECGKVRPAVTETVVINFAEFAWSEQTDTLGKACDSG